MLARALGIIFVCIAAIGLLLAIRELLMEEPKDQSENFAHVLALLAAGALLWSVGSIEMITRGQRKPPPVEQPFQQKQAVQRMPLRRKFRVFGTDPQSGFETSVVIEDSDSTQASLEALRRGLTQITRIDPV